MIGFENVGLDGEAMFFGVLFNAFNIFRPYIYWLHEDCQRLYFSHGLKRGLKVFTVALGVSRSDRNEDMKPGNLGQPQGFPASAWGWGVRLVNLGQPVGQGRN